MEIYSGSTNVLHLHSRSQEHEMMMKYAVIYQRWQRRRKVVPTLPQVPVWVELSQIPVIHILQSLLGRVTVTRPLQGKVKCSLTPFMVVFL